MREGNHFMTVILSCITLSTPIFYSLIPFERIIIRKNDIVITCSAMTGLFCLSCCFFNDDIRVQHNKEGILTLYQALCNMRPHCGVIQ
jgi:hypothetical protein